nr:mitogen-activated protein kinase kinase kinase YODA-like [Tanacetum cinerariifolium]
MDLRQRSIHKLLQEYGHLGEIAIRSYTNQILSGLAYLHSKNTFHSSNDNEIQVFKKKWVKKIALGSLKDPRSYCTTPATRFLAKCDKHCFLVVTGDLGKSIECGLDTIHGKICRLDYGQNMSHCASCLAIISGDRITIRGKICWLDYGSKRDHIVPAA